MLIELSKFRIADNGQYVFVDLCEALGQSRATAQNRFPRVSSEYRGVGKAKGAKHKVRTLTFKGIIEYLVYSKDAKNVVNLMDRQCSTPSIPSTMD